jgi:hypothetical protein
MSRKIRFAVALLILSSLSLSLDALPLSHPRVAPREESALMVIVDWLASFFPGTKPQQQGQKAPNRFRSKVTYSVDPNGSH